MRSGLLTIWLLGCMLGTLPASALGTDHAATLAVVVPASAELSVNQSLSSKELGQIYLKKKQRWNDGTRIHPVNLHAEHPSRVEFSKIILGSLPAEQADYWNGLYFHGTTPPYSVQSEEAVIRYVSTTKGAIGYVNACNLDERIKPVLWIHDGNVSTSKPALNCTGN